MFPYYKYMCIQPRVVAAVSQGYSFVVEQYREQESKMNRSMLHW